ncbi:MAG: sigma-54 dependent transcriptional regulator [Bacteroidota bacterium]
MKKNSGYILVVDDDEDVLQAARLFLKKHVAAVHTEKNPAMIPALLQNGLYDVVLLDMNFTRDATSGQEGFQWLKRILEIDPSAVVVLITAYGDVGMAVRAMKEGAMDFVLKPWHNEKLLATISAALNLRRSRLEADSLRMKQKQLSADLDQPFQRFIGKCPAMQAVFASIQKVARTDANVLILGGNGTGKELVARELHRQSNRADDVFISVDMGAISETLFEGELFGHVRGAFTDAKDDRPGRFEIASGGTLFLDEICNLPLTLQAKILTALEGREVTRLGSNKPISIDIRLICATNMSIHEMVAQKQFRQDLLYRINTIEIHLPPLRERSEDIPLLADHFLKIFCKKYQVQQKQISQAALRKLEHYHWPGNIRELQHTIERAVILGESPALQPSDFSLGSAEAATGGITFETYNLEEAEKLLIGKAIEKHRGNVSKAAKELGLTRTSLYRRMERYGL